MKEAALAKVIMDRLIDDGWDCYPEAEFKTYSGRADIAAKRGRILWVVECKTTLGLGVIAQARAWKGYANYRSVAVPKGRYTKSRSMAIEVCSLLGIGVLEVYEEGFTNPKKMVRESVRPRLDRKIGGKFVDLLHEDMKRYAPGSTSDKGYSTPWKRTMDAAVAFIQRQPGCTVRELLDSIDHHYHSLSSAKTAVPNWLRDPRFPVDVKKEGNCLKLYPKETT